MPNSRNSTSPKFDADILSANDTPFVIPFQTDQARYLYDTNTNQILCVDAQTHAVAPKYTPQYRKSNQTQTHNRKASGELQKVFECIEAAQTDGLLLAQRPTAFGRPSEERIAQAVKSQMSYATFCLTENCNMRCEYCVYSGDYRHFRSHSRRVMSEEVLEKGLNQFFLRSREAEDVSLGCYGGEPLLAFDAILHMVKHWRHLSGGQDPDLCITTNGLLLEGEKADFLAQHRVQLLVSLDGPQNLHDRYRRDIHGNGTFERVITNLRKLRQRFPDYYREKVRLNLTLVPPYDLFVIHDFLENHELIADTAVRVSNIDRSPNLFYPRFEPQETRSRHFEIFRARYISAKHKGETPGRLERELFELPVKRIYKRSSYSRPLRDAPLNGACIPGVAKAFVDVDGRIHACEKIGSGHPIGDVERGLDLDKVNSLLGLYEKICFESGCLNCWAVRLCRSCFVSVVGKTIDREMREENCQRTRSNLLYDLTLLCKVLEGNDKAFGQDNGSSAS